MKDLDDLTEDDFMEMSEADMAKVDAMLDQELEHFDRWYRGLSFKGKIAYNRREALRAIGETRRRLHDPKFAGIEFLLEMTRASLRRQQIRLVKIRIWRSTGIYPGQG